MTIKKKILLCVCAVVMLLSISLPCFAISTSPTLPKTESYQSILNISGRYKNPINNEPTWVNITPPMINPPAVLGEVKRSISIASHDNTTNPYAFQVDVYEKTFGTPYGVGQRLRYVTHDELTQSYIYYTLEDVVFADPDHDPNLQTQYNPYALYRPIDVYVTRNVVDEYYDAIDRLEITFNWTTFNNVTTEQTSTRITHTVSTPRTNPYQDYFAPRVYGIDLVEILRANGQNPSLGMCTEIVVRAFVDSVPTEYGFYLLQTDGYEKPLEYAYSNGFSDGKHSVEWTTDIPTDWFGWIVDGVGGFLALELLPGVTLFTVFAGVMGLLLFIMIMRKFAGG